LYQESFTYLPQFKLVVAGNQKPGLTSVDEGIRRRLNVIPFIALIRAEDRDPDLAEKLKAEWPGILAWAIQGCLMWQKHGLLPPPAITAATSDYLEAEDLVGRWLADCCTIGPALRTPSADLFDCWKKWAEASNEPQRTHKRFSQALADRGFQSYRVTGGRAGFVGLAIKSQLELAVIRGGLRQ
jgi:putative DNA primase/helicase